WSITAMASSTKDSTPTWWRSAGRWEPPVPRWFQETTRILLSGRSRDGVVHGLVPSPLHNTTVGPSSRQSGSLVQALITVPSAETTSKKKTWGIVVPVVDSGARAAMRSIVAHRPEARRET